LAYSREKELSTVAQGSCPAIGVDDRAERIPLVDLLLVLHFSFYPSSDLYTFYSKRGFTQKPTDIDFSLHPKISELNLSRFKYI